MKLVSFSVSNYRSIIRANKLRIDSFTSLVGPNNEGKSNILRALVIALEALESAQGVKLRRGRMRYGRGSVERYDWELDYPVSKQERFPNGKSQLDLEFQLSEQEQSEFKNEIKSTLNETLPIRIEFGQNSVEFSIRKPGKGKAALMQKRSRIVSFLSRRIGIAYIPAIRTAREAEEIVERLVSRALSRVEFGEDYQQALQIIEGLQAPVLRQLGEELTETMKLFMPKISTVTLDISDNERSYALRRGSTITVDDGTPTSLSRKGDGIQSLAALSLMRFFSQRGFTERQLILAIEEPESHLHPEAIHELKAILADISKNAQVILTTHNPLFVNREKLESNILVQDSRAVAASSIDGIRKLLGVRASDNLRHSEVVLLVEGEEDRRALAKLLPISDSRLIEPLEKGILAIDSMNGGTNLSYKLAEARAAISTSHCLLDNDKCGIESFEKAKQQGLLSDGDVNFTICQGREESELEDLYTLALYENFILNKYNVSLTHKKFKGRRKWSNRMEATFTAHGKRWDTKFKAKLKNEICELVEAQPENSLEPTQQSVIDALCMSLRAKLKIH